MLSSKELIEKTGLSRATISNYVALGLFPKPVVGPPRSPRDRARRLGHFPDTVLRTLEQIEDLKKQGYRMSEIVERLGRRPAPDGTPAPPERTERKVDAGPTTEARGLRLTIGELDYPAYLVNNKFELEWSNHAADELVLANHGNLSQDIVDRNVFRLILESDALAGAESRDEILRFHLAIAKNRLSKTALLTLDPQMEDRDLEKLADIYDSATSIERRALVDTDVNLAPRAAPVRRHRLYASFFREGAFFAYVPVEADGDSFLTLLSRRDLVIRDLLKSRRPYMTPLAVLVADIQNSVRICSELPPEEYFELINQVWAAMEPKFRQCYATHGKHVGDGILYYFFPQPDCNYAFNAVKCAYEMQQAMKDINAEWRARKNWKNELKLNIGLDEGREWFGSYETPTHLEFTVLGDTVNRAARLSDFARGGSVWVTKNVLGMLNSRERAKLKFGIRQLDDEGEPTIVESTYSRIDNLVDLDAPNFAKLRDIAVLPVTEILDLEPDA